MDSVRVDCCDPFDRKCCSGAHYVVCAVEPSLFLCFFFFVVWYDISLREVYFSSRCTRCSHNQFKRIAWEAT